MTNVLYVAANEQKVTINMFVKLKIKKKLCERTRHKNIGRLVLKSHRKQHWN